MNEEKDILVESKHAIEYGLKKVDRKLDRYNFVCYNFERKRPGWYILHGGLLLVTAGLLSVSIVAGIVSALATWVSASMFYNKCFSCDLFGIKGKLMAEKKQLLELHKEVDAQLAVLNGSADVVENQTAVQNINMKFNVRDRALVSPKRIKKIDCSYD